MADLREWAPSKMHLECPKCGTTHIDEGEWATRPHKTHQCQNCKHECDALRPYREALLDGLANPDEAAHYLNAAIDDSPEMFLKALRNVAQAHQMAKVAKQSGVTRGNLYRAFSEKGNPTLDTLVSVLNTVGLKIAINTKIVSASGSTGHLEVEVAKLREERDAAEAALARERSIIASKLDDILTLLRKTGYSEID